MDASQMFALATALAAAKSRQDVAAAVRLLHPEMVLEAPAFGTDARGLEHNRATLARFFATFPDYEVTLEGHATDGTTLICWGTARMTMTGDRFGVRPNSRRAELPVVIAFEFADGLISRERFLLDLAQLCAQSGVSTDAVQRTLFPETAVA
jgi:predicted ester cyclase